MLTTFTFLDTDAYKFSMAIAGLANEETFYYSHRKGGPHFLPFDVERYIRSALPKGSAEQADADFTYLAVHGYDLPASVRDALMNGEVEIKSIPQGSWFFDREPVFTVTGPSELVSWLEPVALQLSYAIQIATCAILNPNLLAEKIRNVTCEEERNIIYDVMFQLQSLGYNIAIRTPLVCTGEYQDIVQKRAQELVDLVGDPNRIFEVGMRAVSGNAQHILALEAISKTGISKTSNVEGARTTGMTPVGTMGHEHIQRHGSDLAAFTAMRDRHRGFVFYLPDTFSTLESGVPTAIRVMREDLSRASGIRFDSEAEIEEHYRFTVNAIRAIDPNWHPVLALESGWNLALTQKFEAIREELGWPADKQVYGYGGYLVKPPWAHFGRDDVSAVWKITQTGDRPTMKFGDEPNGGKSSIPGKPVIWRAPISDPTYEGPVGIIAQEGEEIENGFVLLTENSEALMFSASQVTRKGLTKAIPSPMTEKLIANCVTARDLNMGK